MSNLAQLKQKARSFEQREQWQPALEVYEQIALKCEGEDADLGLFNRMGDLLARLDRAGEAVVAYERAVDAYAAAGLHNNAIALCNKILRTAPARPDVYRKLGLISAFKGFLADARQHFAQHVELVARDGRADEALDDLRAAVDAYPDDASSARRLLAEQFQARGRDADALELFRAAHRGLLQAGRTAEADQVRAQIAALDIAPAPAARPAVDVFAEEDADDDGDAGFLSLPDAVLPRETGDPAPTAAAGDEDRTGDADDPELLSLVEIAPLEGFETTAFELEIDDLDGLESAPTVSPHPPALDAGPAEIDAAAGEPDLSLDLPLAWAAESEMDADDDPGDPPLPALTLIFPEPESEPESESEPALQPAGEAEPETDEEDSDHGAISLDWPGALLTPLDDDAPPLVLLTASADFGGAEEADAEEADPEPAADPDPTAALCARIADEPADRAAIRDLVARLRVAGPDAESVRVLEDAATELAEREAYTDALATLGWLTELVPADLGLLYRQVEVAFRTGEADVLIGAYLALAQRLEAEGGPEKARAILERVLELDPDHPTARAALGFPAAAPGPADGPADGGYVDLAALIFDDEPESETTRWVVEAEAPTGDEDHDFAEILARFREQVARNLAPDDATSHYDLGVAFKEMGLHAEAIAQFQQALQAGANPIATLEMLGECFVAQDQPAIGRRVLDRAVRLAGAADPELVGVLYWMGRCDEALGNRDLAAECFERVLAVDFEFRDVARRLGSLRERGAAPPL